MTLQAQFEQELDEARQRRSGHGGRRGRSRGNSRATSSSATRSPCRSTGCGSRRRSWRRADAADLERIGKALSDRLTYLMEPIARSRSTPQACVVQLRSNPPQTRRRRPQLLRAARPPRRRNRARALPQRKRQRPPADRRDGHARSAAAAGRRFLRGAGLIALQFVDFKLPRLRARKSCWRGDSFTFSLCNYRRN